MAENGPDSRNPLAPLYTTDLPSLQGNGRWWFAILVAVLLLASTLYWLVSLVV